MPLHCKSAPGLSRFPQYTSQSVMPSAKPPSSVFTAAIRDDVQSSGDWIFVDIGFSKRKRSSGIAVGDQNPEQVRFRDLSKRIAQALHAGKGPANLLIEAPLSVAFDRAGNPTPRSIERQGDKRRDWYSGAGPTVLLAAMHLLRSLADEAPQRPIRLIEGFLSFKMPRTRSSHAEDVARLRDVAWRIPGARGCIVPPVELTHLYQAPRF